MSQPGSITQPGSAESDGQVARTGREPGATEYPGRRRGGLIGATVLSAVAVAAGAAWLTGVLPGFYTEPGNAMLADVAGSAVATVVHTVVALLGVAAGLLGLTGVLHGRGIALVGITQVAVFGFGMGSMGTLAVLGYLVAFCVPVVIVVLLVQVIRKYPRARWAVGAPALVAVVLAGVFAGPAIFDALVKSATALAEDGGAVGPVLLLLAVATTWAAVVARAARGGAERITTWVLRHRTALTIVAATGPLPYALMRLTWFTPWPILAPGSIDMSTRAWGLLLSGGAWIGVALTIGLIRQWGEVFPRWVPGLAGRPVPVAAAAVPGGFVAGALIFAAVPMLVAFGQGGPSEFLLGAIAFPCWYWGPALALAVWGYVAHRSQRPAADRARA